MQSRMSSWAESASIRMGHIPSRMEDCRAIHGSAQEGVAHDPGSRDPRELVAIPSISAISNRPLAEAVEPSPEKADGGAEFPYRDQNGVEEGQRNRVSVAAAATLEAISASRRRICSPCSRRSRTRLNLQNTTAFCMGVARVMWKGSLAESWPRSHRLASRENCRFGCIGSDGG